MMMKAAVMYAPGGPEVLRLESRSIPVPSDDEVLIRVKAFGINRSELFTRQGLSPNVRFPRILGIEVVGVVEDAPAGEFSKGEALGEGVEDLSIGDRVFSMADQTYAELCVVPATSLAKIPEGIDLVDAAALPLVTTTGNMLITEGTGITSGKTILITGADGNVGRSAVYIAKALGAIVIAGVLRSQLEDASQIGADQLVATDDPDAMEKLPMLNAVADAVAGKTAEVLIAKVKPGGVFATVLDAPANAKDYPEVKVVTVQAKPNPKIVLYMADAVRQGKLVIPIGQRVAMADAAKAHEAIAKGSAHGKVLLVNDPLDEEITEAKEAVKKLLAAYNAALNESKTDAVMLLYAKDGIFMPPFSPSAIGLEAIRTAYDEVFVTRKFDVVFHLAELVILAPSWAYSRTNSAGHTTNPQTKAENSGGNQELFLFNKGADGAWKIYRYSFSPTAPPK